MKKNLSFLVLGLTLLLLGAGCSKAKPETLTQTTAATREQQAYVYCTNKGHTAKIRFDSEVNRNQLWCLFESGRECDALEFMTGKCDPQKAESKQEANTSLTPPGTRFYCEPITKPVCTTDDQTYTNRCLAEAQGKKVKYEGVCNEKDEPFVLEAPSDAGAVITKSDEGESSVKRSASWPAESSSKVESEKESGVSSPSRNSATADPPGTSDWVHDLIALLQSSASPYQITLAECVEGNKKYYFQEEDCPNCFKILYSSSGESLCYPGLNQSQCPAWREKNCKIIWQK